MLITYLFIALIILSIILVVIAFLNFNTLKTNPNFSTNLKIKNAYYWSITVIVGALVCLFSSIGTFINLRSAEYQSTKTYYVLEIIIILGAFFGLVTSVLTIINFSNIYGIIALIINIILFVISLYILVTSKKLPLYISKNRCTDQNITPEQPPSPPVNPVINSELITITKQIF